MDPERLPLHSKFRHLPNSGALPPPATPVVPTFWAVKPYNRKQTIKSIAREGWV